MHPLRCRRGTASHAPPAGRLGAELPAACFQPYLASILVKGVDSRLRRLRRVQLLSHGQAQLNRLGKRRVSGWPDLQAKLCYELERDLWVVEVNRSAAFCVYCFLPIQPCFPCREVWFQSLRRDLVDRLWMRLIKDGDDPQERAAVALNPRRQRRSFRRRSGVGGKAPGGTCGRRRPARSLLLFPCTHPSGDRADRSGVLACAALRVTHRSLTSRRRGLGGQDQDGPASAVGHSGRFGAVM